MQRLPLCAFFLLAMAPARLSAQTILPVSATVVSLSTTADSEQRVYLVLDLPTIDVPKGMWLEEAILNLYMDTSTTRVVEGVSEQTVTLEVYPYRGIAKARIDPSKIGTSAMKRTVHVGAGKSVKVYVTDFVNAFTADPTLSRKLVVGSVSGARAADFDPKVVPGTSNAKATLTVYFSRVEEAKYDSSSLGKP